MPQRPREDEREEFGRSAAAAVVRRTIAIAESGVYVIVGVLLVVAAVMTIAGTVDETLDAVDRRTTVAIGVRVLDRILLLFIIAELLFTLRLTIFGSQILAEPFLLIGLIAVVRRILVITAESETVADGGRELTNFLLELGMLALLAIALSVAIALLRRSARAAGGPGRRSATSSAGESARG